MDINVVGLIATCIIAWVAWWINDSLNKVAILNTIIKVVIVVVALLLLWQYLGIRHHTLSV